MLHVRPNALLLNRRQLIGGAAAMVAYAALPTPARAAKFSDIYGALSVKDPQFGATGNGTTDDSAAIQACFDTAFGTTGSPHGSTNKYLNKVVVFPPGDYKIVTPLTLRSVLGGRIIGSGVLSTRLFYAGSVAGGGTLTSLISTNGCAYSQFEGINFEIAGTNTAAFNLDWDNTGEVALNANQFTQCRFAGGSVGMLIGISGFMGSENVFLNSYYDNNTVAGIKTGNFNALQQTIIGGGADNNGNTGLDAFKGAAFYGDAGSFQLIASVGFGLSNNYCIRQISGDGCIISGCRSEGDNFALLDGTVGVMGCTHQGLNNGYFVKMIGGGARTIIDASNSTKGEIIGHGTDTSTSKVYLRGCNFTRADYLTNYNGNVVQNI